MASELDQQFSFHRYRKLRIHFAWLSVVFVALFARSTPEGFLIGTPFIVAGEALRIWAHGYLRKARRLATDGPYAFVRNPLYVGNLLLGAGFCIIIWNPIIFFIFIGGFFALYWVTVKGEEQRLSFKFQNEYKKYTREVPRFFPKLKPYKNRSFSRFAAFRIWGHGEQITLYSIITLWLLLLARQEFYQYHHSINPFNLSVTLLAFVFGFLTLNSVMFRYRDRKNKKRSRNPKFQTV